MFNSLFAFLTVLLNLLMAAVSVTGGGPSAVIIGLNYGPILNGLLLLFGLACTPFAAGAGAAARRLKVVTLLPIGGAIIQAALMLLSSS